jgi:hypothetical protein
MKRMSEPFHIGHRRYTDKTTTVVHPESKFRILQVLRIDFEVTGCTDAALQCPPTGLLKKAARNRRDSLLT